MDAASRGVVGAHPKRVTGHLADFFGRDMDEILKDYLGYDDEKIAELIIAEALV